MDTLDNIPKWLIVSVVIVTILWSCSQFIRNDGVGADDGEEET